MKTTKLSLKKLQREGWGYGSVDVLLALYKVNYIGELVICCLSLLKADSGSIEVLLHLRLKYVFVKHSVKSLSWIRLPPWLCRGEREANSPKTKTLSS